MQDHYAVIVEQFSAFLEKSFVMANADMLEHADRDDTLKRLV
jgi:hypothetical protein